MRVACLCLDSRPVNTQFLQELAAWAGSEAVLPRPEEMDCFRTPGSFEGAMAFLRRELPRADAAVISLDRLCFGSLIASRAEESASPQDALNRLEALQALLADHPQVPVYAFSVIMRSSISTLSAGDLTAYRAMTEYSVHCDRFDRFGLEEDRQAMEAARALMPEGLLDRVLRVRERNLSVNLRAVELAASGVFRSLSLLQEDCQTYGLPRKDQRALLARMGELGTANVYLRNGADEGGAVCLAGALRAGRPAIPAEVITLGEAGFTAPYEDRPFPENLRSACEELGIVPAAGAKNVILVCCPEHGEQEEAERPAREGYLRLCAERADELVASGRQVYLLDVVRANGGSLDLVRAMKRAEGLAGYSAWNTASNSMGTLLAQLVTDDLRGEANFAFLEERLLDDLFYQGLLRQTLQEQLCALGEDVYALTDKPRAEAVLAQLFARELPALWPLPELPAYRTSLPWPRTFEMKAEVPG